MKRVFLLLLALVSSGVTLQADTPQQAFVKAWQGRPVTVKWPLYTLVYNERGKFGTSREGLREGLVVTTLSQGAYLQFDPRQGRDVVRGSDPERFVAAVNAEYEADALDVRAYRKLEALTIRRYDPGVALRITAVRVDRDQVWFEFADETGTEAVTAMRVKWAGPLSNAFTERETVERLLRQFVDVTQPLGTR